MVFLSTFTPHGGLVKRYVKEDEINHYKKIIANIKSSYFLNKRNITIFFMNIDKCVRKLFESEFDLRNYLIDLSTHQKVSPFKKSGKRLF